MWQFVAALLETAVGERLRMQRACIMRVCDVSASKGCVWPKPSTLAEVAANVETALEHTRSGFFQDMYLQLREYFRIVMPQIARLPKASRMDLKAGLNIMFLDALPEQMQALCIASCTTWCRTREQGTVVILPEATKFAGKTTPALHALRTLICEGAVLQNFLWMDSQTITGIDAELRKQVGVWILGRQGEAIEAERTIKQLPSDMRRIRPADVQQLRLGQFFVSWGDGTRQVYVQPGWMGNDMAWAVATTGSRPPAPPKAVRNVEDEMWREQAEAFKAELAQSQQTIKELEAIIAGLNERSDNQEKIIKQLNAQSASVSEAQAQSTPSKPSDTPDPKLNGACLPLPSPDMQADQWFSAVWPLVRDRVAADPQIVQLLQNQNEIRVTVKTQQITLSDDTLRGRLALLIAEGFFDVGRKSGQVLSKLDSIGQRSAPPNLSRELAALTTMGFLLKDGTTYTKKAGVKITTTGISA
jgi:hypothetical protein